MIKYADFIQLGSPPYKSHFVQIVTFKYDVNGHFFMSIPDMTTKYVPEKFELISRKQKDFFYKLSETFPCLSLLLSINTNGT